MRRRSEGVQDQVVTTDLDTLATALYCEIDDLLKESPRLAPWRPKVGITPKLSGAELVTMAMMQALLGYVSEARWLRHARAHLSASVPLPAQTAGLQQAAADSTPVECGRSRETVKRSDLAGWTEYG